MPFVCGHCAHGKRLVVAKRSVLVVRWRPRCDTLSTPTSRRNGLADWRGGVDIVVAATATTAAQQHQHPRFHVRVYVCRATVASTTGWRPRRARGKRVCAPCRTRVQSVTSADESLCIHRHRPPTDPNVAVITDVLVCVARARILVSRARVPRARARVYRAFVCVRECDARDNPTTETTTVRSSCVSRAATMEYGPEIT